MIDNKHRTDSLVSIIVPIFNTEEYLSKCIESLCNQTYSNIQIILVDDNSTDNSLIICNNYAKNDSRIMVIHQENKGVSGARNSGLKYATGMYIMFVDSDDELYANAIELLINDAYQYDADIVSAVKAVMDQKRKATRHDDGKVTIFKKEDSILLSLAGDRNTNSACAKLFKASFLKGISFVEGKNIHEDGYFLFQCYLRQPKLIQHDVTVYQYNCRENSSSKQKFSDKYLSILEFCLLKKRHIISLYPQFINECFNMEVRTHLQFLDLLCRTNEKKYKKYETTSIEIVCKLKKYHKPINRHHRQLAWITTHGLYSLYKFAVRLKYF